MVLPFTVASADGSQYSNIYNVELDTLLAAAGIIEKKSSSNKLLNSVALSSDSPLTKEEEEALLDYLRFIRQKQK